MYLNTKIWLGRKKDVISIPNALHISYVIINGKCMLSKSKQLKRGGVTRVLYFVLGLRSVIDSFKKDMAGRNKSIIV